MLKEIEINPFDSYLLCTCSFSDKMLERVKADVKAFMVDRKRDDLYYEFIYWQKKANEIAVLTMHAYTDIALPKQFDTVFQVDDTDNYIDTNLVIKQAVLNGWTPVNQIDHGHKHIIIIEFSNSIPGIFNLLSDFSNSEVDKSKIKLGFCNKVDFEAIKENLKQPVS